ncbi:hypothetical protein H257_06972 [Aphanomyces astaci]|uniref:Granulins domain-containing protein n=1 Tax=Aphanomyces astaci TaxID=112090 RepID=W4GJ57_APHAT|nr:hypothetical protein H257_06972 [Aphanomyces astaci]ETV79735.1 hypothetical protein H257_06972 [Aphanomyces astaci]|eukprot:XP_009830671.1 hypothetical protein H257_06972 [Aphanomyces astaci]
MPSRASCRISTLLLLACSCCVASATIDACTAYPQCAIAGPNNTALWCCASPSGCCPGIDCCGPVASNTSSITPSSTTSDPPSSLPASGTSTTSPTTTATAPTTIQPNEATSKERASAVVAVVGLLVAASIGV